MPQSITLQLKRLGKKRVKNVPYTLPAPVSTLRELLTACVTSEVDRYNRRQAGEEVLPYLLPAHIDEQLSTGKIGFGNPAEKREAKLEDSIATALLGFEDGLYAVFIDQDEIKSPDEAIEVGEASVVTFIRLTFLSGTYW